MFKLNSTEESNPSNVTTAKNMTMPSSMITLPLMAFNFASLVPIHHNKTADLRG